MIPHTHTSQPATPAEPTAPEVHLVTVALVIVASFLLGCLVPLVIHLPWLVGLQASVSGAQPKAFWYVSRATAFVAFGLLWLSMALGLSITNKLARLWPGGPAATDLHQYTSLLGLALGCFHGLILAGDGYSHYTLGQLLIPFATTQYRPVWVGLGQFGLYLGAVVALSFYVRRFIGYRVWRLLHYLSFAFYLMVLVHGIFSGTDSGTVWAQGLYLGSAISLVGLTIYRIVVARRTPARRTAQATASARPATGGHNDAQRRAA